MGSYFPKIDFMQNAEQSEVSIRPYVIIDSQSLTVDDNVKVIK